MSALKHLDGVPVPAMPAEERARLALDAMTFGFRLKLASLQRRFPQESAEEVRRRFEQWLAAERDGD